VNPLGGTVAADQGGFAAAFGNAPPPGMNYGAPPGGPPPYGAPQGGPPPYGAPAQAQYGAQPDPYGGGAPAPYGQPPYGQPPQQQAGGWGQPQGAAPMMAYGQAPGGAMQVPGIGTLQSAGVGTQPTRRNALMTFLVPALVVGETVAVGYVDQSREALNPNKTVWEEISGGLDVLELGKRTMQSRAYVGAFNFKGGDQQKKVGSLSGGERNRVHLAKMLKSGANLLLLDEPTNDLDVETLRALEAALEDFAGCAMIISHDRWFLDRIATHMLAFEGDSHVEWFEGNYNDYEADRKRRVGIDADQPHRIKYKRFARA
jgi:ABC-type dipeptide/oligopeptide/nickel transport system ATPase subunit